MDVNNYIKIPQCYQNLQTLPEDPDGTIVFGCATSQSQGFVKIHPIDSNGAMPFDNNAEIIYGIYDTLTDNQALIEVANGVTTSNLRYVYSIVKSLMSEHGGVQYTCVFHLETPDGVISASAFFGETGMTGMRDTTIFSALKSQGYLDGENAMSWQFDPYFKDSKRGYQMNLSELEQFDTNFPEHPLSLLRAFIKHLING